jgi:patatin-like phospholipase/acyl hydrolase
MPAENLVKILSIDGGGIRGIIPALMLAEIERLTGRAACELFDLIAGTSTGGIIALGVSVPGAEGKPRWSARDLADLYASEGPKIFHRSLLHTVETADGVLEERYAATGLEAALERYMGDARLPQALTDVLITSYDIRSHEPFFFKSFQPRAHGASDSGNSAATPTTSAPPPQPADYPMKVVARATSAAPTYFEPEHLSPSPSPAGGPPIEAALVDGGTFANNPAMCAYAEAKRNHPDADVLIVSLGTGRLTESISFEEAKHWGLVRWARPLLGVIMDGSSAAIDYQLASNIAALRALAEASIAKDAARLAEVSARLTSTALD